MSQVVHDHRRRLREIGLELNLSKTKCYIKPNFRTPRFHELRGTIEEGTMPNLTEGAEEGSMSRRIVAYGVTIGDDDVVNSFLVKRANRIVGDLATIGNRMSPHEITVPELTSRQCLYCGN